MRTIIAFRSWESVGEEVTFFFLRRFSQPGPRWWGFHQEMISRGELKRKSVPDWVYSHAITMTRALICRRMYVGGAGWVEQRKPTQAVRGANQVQCILWLLYQCKDLSKQLWSRLGCVHVRFCTCRRGEVDPAWRAALLVYSSAKIWGQLFSYKLTVKPHQTPSRQIPQSVLFISIK